DPERFLPGPGNRCPTQCMMTRPEFATRALLLIYGCQTGKTTEKTLGRRSGPEHFSAPISLRSGASCCGANRCYAEQFLAGQGVASAYGHVIRGSDRFARTRRRGSDGCPAWRSAARAPSGRTLFLQSFPSWLVSC